MNRKMIKGLYCILFLGVPIFSQTDPATWYPKVDNNQWTIDSWTNGIIQGARKGIISAPGAQSNPEMIFSQLRLYAATINGVNYLLNQVVGTNMSSLTYSDHIERSVDYTVGPWTVRTVYSFFTNGSFSFRSSFLSSLPSTAKLYLKCDVDLNGKLNDIVEYPQLLASTNTESWFAPTNEIQKSVSPIPLTIAGIRERTAYFRVVDAGSSDAGTQPFVVFWPYNPFQADNSSIDFIFKNWTAADENGTTIPIANTGTFLQSVNPGIHSYQPSAYKGGDILVYAAISGSSTFSGSRYDIAGKVFQKPNGRSLRINFHTEPLRPVPQNWATASVQFGNSGRSANDAFNDLTNGKWQLARYDGMINSVPAGAAMTSDQLNALMLSERSRVSNYDGNNFRDWTVDVLVVNHRSANFPDANGLMFDGPGRNVPGRHETQPALNLV